MTVMHLNSRFALVTLLPLALSASDLLAQACHGTPGRGGVAYEYGRFAFGHTQGVSGVLAGKRTALALGLRLRDLGSDYSGQEGAFRFSMIFPASKVQICPGIAIGYGRDVWDPEQGLSLTSHNVSLRTGAGFGLEQEVYRGFSVIPFFVAQYEFAITYFNIKVPDGTSSVSGDTLSLLQMEYGLLGRYRMIYGGIAANRSSQTEGLRPNMARWILGFAFGGGGGGTTRSRGSPMPSSTRVSASAPRGVPDRR